MCGVYQNDNILDLKMFAEAGLEKNGIYDNPEI